MDSKIVNTRNAVLSVRYIAPIIRIVPTTDGNFHIFRVGISHDAATLHTCTPSELPQIIRDLWEQEVKKHNEKILHEQSRKPLGSFELDELLANLEI